MQPHLKHLWYIAEAVAVFGDIAVAVPPQPTHTPLPHTLLYNNCLHHIQIKANINFKFTMPLFEIQFVYNDKLILESLCTVVMYEYT